MIKSRVASAAFIASLATAVSAQAADLPAAAPIYKAPAFVQAAPYNWSGFYVGGNVGYGWATASASVTAPTSLTGEGSENLDGGVFGGQLGYNWQFDRFVFGVETDIQGTTQKASQNAACSAATCGVAVSASRDSKLPWFGSTRARFGYAFDRWMPYFTVGLGYGEHSTEVSVTAGGSSGTASSSETRAGLAVGGGVEVGLGPHWSARLEYLYLDSGTVTTSTNIAGYGTVSVDEHLRDNILRGGLNYRF